MAGQPRPFFELTAAAALSRTLTGSPAGTTMMPAPPAPPVAPQVVTPPAREFPAFQRPEVQYAEELWQALLTWTNTALGGSGAFALDERGFAIGSVGGGMEVPPEVLLAAFTSVAQLLEAYLGTERTVRRIEVAAQGEPPVTMLNLHWAHEGVLIGIIGGRSPSEREVEIIRTTITAELDLFAARGRETQERPS